MNSSPNTQRIHTSPAQPRNRPFSVINEHGVPVYERTRVANIPPVEKLVERLAPFGSNGTATNDREIITAFLPLADRFLRAPAVAMPEEVVLKGYEATRAWRDQQKANNPDAAKELDDDKLRVTGFTKAILGLTMTNEVVQEPAVSEVLDTGVEELTQLVEDPETGLRHGTASVDLLARLRTVRAANDVMIHVLNQLGEQVGVPSDETIRVL